MNNTTKVKVYSVNTDGTFDRFVAANSRSEAARLLRVSSSAMANYGSETENPDMVAAAMGEFGAVFSRHSRRFNAPITREA